MGLTRFWKCVTTFHLEYEEFQSTTAKVRQLTPLAQLVIPVTECAEIILLILN